MSTVAKPVFWLAVLAGLFAVHGTRLAAQSVTEPAPLEGLHQPEYPSFLKAHHDAVIAAILKQAYDAETQLEDLRHRREQVISADELRNVSPASFEEILRLLQTQRVMLTIDLAGLDARREAILAATASAESAPQPINDELLRGLAALVDEAKESLHQLQQLHEQGSVSSREVSRAKMAVVEAEIRLLETHQRLAAEKAGGDDPELGALALDRAEKSARLQRVMELSAELARARPQIDAAVEISRQIEMAEREALELRRQLNSTRTQFGTMDLPDQRIPPAPEEDDE